VQGTRIEYRTGRKELIKNEFLYGDIVKGKPNSALLFDAPMRMAEGKNLRQDGQAATEGTGSFGFHFFGYTDAIVFIS
jgi:hypothetical protein